MLFLHHQGWRTWCLCHLFGSGACLIGSWGSWLPSLWEAHFEQTLLLSGSLHEQWESGVCTLWLRSRLCLCDTASWGFQGSHSGFESSLCDSFRSGLGPTFYYHGFWRDRWWSNCHERHSHDIEIRLFIWWVVRIGDLRCRQTRVTMDRGEERSKENQIRLSLSLFLVGQVISLKEICHSFWTSMLRHWGPE